MNRASPCHFGVRVTISGQPGMIIARAWASEEWKAEEYHDRRPRLTIQSDHSSISSRATFRLLNACLQIFDECVDNLGGQTLEKRKRKRLVLVQYQTTEEIMIKV